MSPIDPMEMYKRSRDIPLAPQKDQQRTSESDLWGGARDAKDAARVRQHRIDDLQTFTRKKYGRAATAAEIAAYLNEGSQS